MPTHVSYLLGRVSQGNQLYSTFAFTIYFSFILQKHFLQFQYIYSRILCCLGAEYFWQDVIFNSRFFRNISSKCSKKDDDGNGDLKPCAILIGSFQALPTRTLQFQLSDMIGEQDDDIEMDESDLEEDRGASDSIDTLDENL